MIRRLTRAQKVPDALLDALCGPLEDAIAAAAEYVGDSLSDATKRVHARG